MRTLQDCTSCHPSTGPSLNTENTAYSQILSCLLVFPCRLNSKHHPPLPSEYVPAFSLYLDSLSIDFFIKRLYDKAVNKVVPVKLLLYAVNIFRVRYL